MELLLRPSAVMRLTGLSRSSLWRLERAGSFPRKIKIGLRAVAWPESVINQWLRERIADSGKAKITSSRSARSYQSEDAACR
jgi:prophage regulatory protein